MVKVLYILGSGRNGSTLLSQLLAGVPGFFAGGEIRSIWTRLLDNHSCGCGTAFCDCPVWSQVVARALGSLSEAQVSELRRLALSLDRVRMLPRLIRGQPAGELREFRTTLKALYHGSISMAQTMGAMMRSMRRSRDYDANELAVAGKGKLLFEGTIGECEHRIDSGFTLGSMEISGVGAYKGSTCLIEFKNENMLARINGEVCVTIPDLICVLRGDNVEALTTPSATAGMKVSVLVLPAPPHFVTADGLDIFGPGYIGLDRDYVPAV